MEAAGGPAVRPVATEVPVILRAHRGGTAEHQGDSASMTAFRATASATRRSTGSDRFTYPLVVGLVHFLVVQVTATFAFVYGTARSPSPPGNYNGEPGQGEPANLTGWVQNLVEPFRSWDGLWYTSIADQGYGSFATANPAYWPLYPWLMEGGARLTGMPLEVVGWLLSNVFFVVALGFVYALVRLDFPERIARITLWVLALFPMALFFSAVYTESLFLMLAASALYFARTRTWVLAGILGLLAALTRSNGVMLLLPFAVLYVQQYGWAPRRWLTTGLASAALALLPLLGPILFYAYLEAEEIPQTVTNPAFVEVQGQWFRFNATPWETFGCAVSGCEAPLDQPYIQRILRDDADGNPIPYQVVGADWTWVRELVDDPGWGNLTSFAFRDLFAQSDTVELVSLLLFLGLAALGLRILPLYQTAYLLPPLLFPLFQPGAVHPLMSIPRFGIVLFPLFVVLAVLLQRRGPLIAYSVVSGLLLVLFTVQFAHWYWVS